MARLATWLVVLLAVAALAAKPKARNPPEEPDLLALAALLFQDGHLDRAASVLADVDPGKPGLDVVRYHTLRGLIALQQGKAKDAAEQLEAAVAAGTPERPVQPLVNLFLAQARFSLGEYAPTLQALDAAGDAADAEWGLHLMRAQALWRLDRRSEAFEVLSAAERRFPEAHELSRQKVLLLVDLGLYREATLVGRQHLERTRAGVDDHVALAEALRQSRQPEAAAVFLEAARLRWPDDPRVVKQLARCWLDAGKPLAAAGLLERAALTDPGLAFEAAELFRRARQFTRALHMNGQVADQKQKIRQRLGLLIELERFEEAATLGPRLSRLGLMGDDAVRYAFAYACFKVDRFTEAERALEGITDEALFRQGVELRKAIASCRASGGCS